MNVLNKAGNSIFLNEKTRYTPLNTNNLSDLTKNKATNKVNNYDNKAYNSIYTPYNQKDYNSTYKTKYSPINNIYPVGMPSQSNLTTPISTHNVIMSEKTSNNSKNLIVNNLNKIEDTNKYNNLNNVSSNKIYNINNNTSSANNLSNNELESYINTNNNATSFKNKSNNILNTNAIINNSDKYTPRLKTNKDKWEDTLNDAKRMINYRREKLLQEKDMLSHVHIKGSSLRPKNDIASLYSYNNLNMNRNLISHKNYNYQMMDPIYYPLEVPVQGEQIKFPNVDFGQVATEDGVIHSKKHNKGGLKKEDALALLAFLLESGDFELGVEGQEFLNNSNKHKELKDIKGLYM